LWHSKEAPFLGLVSKIRIGFDGTIVSG